MRITSKGQVTIPQDLRERFGLLPLTEVEFVAEGRRLVIRKKLEAATRGRRIVDHIKAHGAGLRMRSRELMRLLRDEPDELDAG
jgi:AbrB family looped-hinge helix DNA binding protein